MTTSRIFFTFNFFIMRSFPAVFLLASFLELPNAQEISDISGVLQDASSGPNGWGVGELSFNQPSVDPANSWSQETLLANAETAPAGGQCPDYQQPAGKRRTRRRGGESCTAPSAQLKKDDNTQPIEAPEPIRIPVFGNIFKGNNPTCVEKTEGRQPLAVCDSGSPLDCYESNYDKFGSPIWVGSLPTSRLEKCALGISPI